MGLWCRVCRLSPSPADFTSPDAKKGCVGFGFKTIIWAEFKYYMGRSGIA